MFSENPVVIPGDHGEGGGQLLRTSLAIAAITGRPLVIERVRALRRNPGLAAQHLSAVRLVAELCAAEVEGAELGSDRLRFRPTSPPRPGDYVCDVAAAREGGSAGSVTMLLQTVALPALFADGACAFHLIGGTHVAWSPPYDYVALVWRPFLARVGVAVGTEIVRHGFYPRGAGEVVARIDGLGAGARAALRPVDLTDRGRILAIRGRAIAANLPAHISERMAGRARALLGEAAPEVDIRPELVAASGPGAGIFLTADYENVATGFGALGRPGKLAETVAEEAVAELIAHDRGGGALDRHLADQVLLPLALARAPSRFTCAPVSGHLRTEAWLIERFGLARVAIAERGDGSALVEVAPAGS